MTDTAHVIIRSAIPADRNFILSTWLKGLYYGNSEVKQMPQELYYQQYADKFLATLNSPDVKVSVACLQDDTNTIIGYLVSTGTAVHWLYVKKDFRSKGIANLLLKHDNYLTYTLSTKAGSAIAKKKKLTYNPFEGDNK